MQSFQEQQYTMFDNELEEKVVYDQYNKTLTDCLQINQLQKNNHPSNLHQSFDRKMRLALNQASYGRI